MRVSRVLVDKTRTSCYSKGRSDQNLKEMTMLPALPFDYLKHLDRHERVRRTRIRPTGSRVRRGKASGSSA